MKQAANSLHLSHSVVFVIHLLTAFLYFFMLGFSLEPYSATNLNPLHSGLQQGYYILSPAFIFVGVGSLVANMAADTKNEKYKQQFYVSLLMVAIQIVLHLLFAGK